MGRPGSPNEGPRGLPVPRGSRICAYLSLSIVIALTAVCAYAADVTGIIIVKQKLTHASVTASVSMYERGPAVELGRDAESDPLAAERARVVIWLEGNIEGVGNEVAGPARSANMQQINRRFEPDTVVIPSGSSVMFPNMDPIFHNVFSLSKPKSFDLGNYPKGDSRTVVFLKPGIVYVNCRLHPNMAGVVVVTPNRWYARADRDGQFALRDVPPGTYTVVAWHKTTGVVRKQIQVVEGRDSVVNFLVPVVGNAENTAGPAKEISQVPDMSHPGATAR
jgi:plastocyanin